MKLILKKQKRIMKLKEPCYSQTLRLSILTLIAFPINFNPNSCVSLHFQSTSTYCEWAMAMLKKQ